MERVRQSWQTGLVSSLKLYSTGKGKLRGQKQARIHEISDALGIPVTWLLSSYDPSFEEQSIQPPITTDELLLIQQYRSMDEQRQKIFEDIVYVLANPGEHTDKQAPSPKPKG